MSCRRIILILAIGLVSLASAARTAQDKYTVKVPNGLAFSEFRGYESWQLVSISLDQGHFAAILANPMMIAAYQAGVPGNGKPFPDGSKMTKIHWSPTPMRAFPAASVPGAQLNADFMEKDSKRFASSGGWGWGSFDYDPASDTFKPATTADKPPQGNNATCGFTCHSIVKTRDYVFTQYAHR
jgi:Cytochrome P460